MERDGLVTRTPHPTHGRILESYPTDEGVRRFEAARPFVGELEDRITAGVAPGDMLEIKRWLVESVRRLR